METTVFLNIRTNGINDMITHRDVMDVQASSDHAL